MPKTAHSAPPWTTSATPQTPLQKGAFLKMCTEWLVSPPQANGEGETEFTTTSSANVTARYPTAEVVSPQIAFTQSELNSQSVFKCFFCGSVKGVHPVIANPFAQQHIILLCDACRKS